MLRTWILAGALAVLAALGVRALLHPGSTSEDAVESGLQYQTLGQFLADTNGVEAVALYDEGAAGAAPAWYLITDPEAASEARFGVHDGRLIDQFLGRQVSIYCNSDGVAQGKIIWALADGAVFKSAVYCNRRRMDLAGLVDVAQPARLEDANALTKADYTALQARINASDQMVAASKSTLSPFDSRCAITSPYLWQGTGVDGYLPGRVEEALRAKMRAALGQSPYDLRMTSGYASSYVMHPADGLETSAEGWPVNTAFTMIAEGGHLYKVPGLSVFRPEFVLETAEAGCAAFDRLDLAAIWAAERDQEIFDRAWAERALTQDPVHENSLTRSTLLSSEGMRQRAGPITYGLRYLVVQER